MSKNNFFVDQVEYKNISSTKYVGDWSTLCNTMNTYLKYFEKVKYNHYNTHTHYYRVTTNIIFGIQHIIYLSFKPFVDSTWVNEKLKIHVEIYIYI